MLANVVRTPLALATADLVNAPQVGIEHAKEPNILHMDRVSIS
jgi:hypothetical protein